MTQLGELLQCAVFRDLRDAFRSNRAAVLYLCENWRHLYPDEIEESEIVKGKYIAEMGRFNSHKAQCKICSRFPNVEYLHGTDVLEKYSPEDIRRG